MRFLRKHTKSVSWSQSALNFRQLRTAHQNVHFAGTATSVEWCGYISGAVQSGYRAVAEVLQDLLPEALTEKDQILLKRAHWKMMQGKSSHIWKPKHQASWFFWDRKLFLGLILGAFIMHRKAEIVNKFLFISGAFLRRING